VLAKISHGATIVYKDHISLISDKSKPNGSRGLPTERTVRIEHFGPNWQPSRLFTSLVIITNMSWSCTMAGTLLSVCSLSLCSSIHIAQCH